MTRPAPRQMDQAHPPYPTPDEFAGMTHEQFVAFLDRIGARRFTEAAAPTSPDVVAVKKVLDRIVANDLAFGKPLTTEYPSRAMLRNDVKELAALLFGDSFHHQESRSDQED